LNSIYNCHRPNGYTEVIVVINQGENCNTEIEQQNLKTLQDTNHWIKSHNDDEKLQFHIIYITDLPKKHAGVGLARKIGMDEAVRRFEHNPNGLIVCFDADSTVAPNYLVELHKYYNQYPKSNGCSIHFEHPLEGNLPQENYLGILNYELHLRYYIHALKFVNYKNAHQTIGSSMAVRSSVYQKQGGMNKRKAGEDFYFLHKIIPLGNFHELTSTMVIPSPRVSDRVPFGTGKAINDFVQEQQGDYYETYNFSSFVDLKAFIDVVPSFYHKNERYDFDQVPLSVLQFFTEEELIKSLNNINKHSASFETFINRFYSFFDGLKVLKYIHFCRDHFYPNTEIKEAIFAWNNRAKLLNITSVSEKKEILLLQRQLDQSTND
ncbi:hypothetical protein OAH12_01575, partial [Cyclobacteriaceae bacterium]|nr:hypothetical protein [Cyclobacteriaceae bacterium]